MDSIYDYSFYQHYLQVFNNIEVAIRAPKINYEPRNKRVASGPGISFIVIPDYCGVWANLRHAFQIRKIVRQACTKADIGIFRIPSLLGLQFAKMFARTHKPFSVEVVADPWENFSPRTSGFVGLLSFYFRQYQRDCRVFYWKLWLKDCHA